MSAVERAVAEGEVVVDARLFPGDIIRVKAAHEVKIDGLGAWISGEVGTTVQEGESTDDAFARAGQVLASRIVGIIETQADPIVRANASQ